MIDTLTTVIWFLVAICILVAVHEYGHYYVARRCGVRVLRFSIGFGRRLFRWTNKHGTEFAISAIPLGGYVKMLDEREMEVDEDERPYSFNAKTPWQRIAIAAAGPLANFILALLLYWMILFLQGTTSLSPLIGKVEPGSIAAEAQLEAGQEIIAIDGEATPTRRAVTLHLLKRLGESGEIEFTTRFPDSSLEYISVANLDNWLRGEAAPNPIQGLGLSFYYPPFPKVIDKVLPGSAAERAGFETGDELLSIDGEAIASWEEWVNYVKARPGVGMEVGVRRHDTQQQLQLVPESYQLEDGSVIGRAGVQVVLPSFPEDMIRRHQYGFFNAFSAGAVETWDTSGFVLLSMKKLLVGEISTKNLSGPIGIAKVAADHAEHGFWAFLSFLAHLSIVLGVLNLLPIPVLDGGHILFCLVEWIKGSPVSEEVQLWGLKVGMVMIFGVMIIAFYNDIFL